ncbi:enoyl-CoA hydratase [Oceanicola sp. 22II-s10i]|uniref:enoyl-CoA hydratase n=1 Tax=Oceanicola sp. 22II-s10i TaxID=1317116 RepID=UPI000B52539E|nr:enoyl-CoA hydratase [Oceanicola sp. 22II-s10i]OWU83751.1 enoyl-CoA hydratase [Oceanicola sp. 22II-s10i]
MSDEKIILSETRDGVTTITLNRPDRLNAWTREMAGDMHAAMTAAGTDPDTRVIVITGAGKGFCAGVDMAGLQTTAATGVSASRSEPHPSAAAFQDDRWPEIGEDYRGRFGYFYHIPKPIIARINGACAGIGLSLVLHCDMRYANEAANFSTAFAARGLIAEHGLAWILPRMIGEGNALELLLSARKFSGREAAEMGMVNAAVPMDQLDDRALGMARLLATQVSPRSMAVIKRQVRAGHHQTFGESLALADAEMDKSLGNPDIKEGVRSYVDRRSPNFVSI